MGGRNGVWLLNGCGFSLWGDKNVLELDSRDGCVSVLNITNGKFYMSYTTIFFKEIFWVSLFSCFWRVKLQACLKSEGETSGSLMVPFRPGVPEKQIKPNLNNFPNSVKCAFAFLAWRSPEFLNKAFPDLPNSQSNLSAYRIPKYRWHTIPILIPPRCILTVCWLISLPHQTLSSLSSCIFFYAPCFLP